MNELVEMLADKVRENERFKEASPHYVSVYRQERCYGGPEEGGWWYDRYELEGSICFPDKESAESYLELMKLEVVAQNEADAPQRHQAMANLPDVETAYHDEGYIPLGWSDGGELMVTIENIAGRMDNHNQARPRYE